MAQFDAKFWLSQGRESEQPSTDGKAVQPEKLRDVERVLRTLEERQLDLTAAYQDWLHIGFALADGFGEVGREYFHRVSRYYHSYDYKECDKQYTYCLRSSGRGISLATFFYLAKEAGIPLPGREPDFDPGLVTGDFTSDIWAFPPTEEVPQEGVDPVAIAPVALQEAVSEAEDRLQELRMMEMAKWNRTQTTLAPTSPASEISEVSGPGEASDPEAGSVSEAASPSGENFSQALATETGSSKASEENASEAPMPTFPKKLYERLPEFLKKVVAPADSSEERDLLLLGSLGAASACFPKLKGLYDSKEYGPNLYLFVAAQASAGKGKMALCKQLVSPLHWKMREQADLLKLDFEQELAEFNSEKGEKEGKRKPQRPPERMLFLPANNSASGMIQLLADNEGRGLIFESEGDTLTQSLRTDFSDYSDSFRKAFHHEGISYFRKTDREYVYIETPSLSTVISGTPKQMVSLIRNREDGLFSRFIFYYLNMQPGFREVFARNPHGNLDAYYNGLGKELLDLHQGLTAQPELWVELSEDQIQRFYTFFRRALAKYRQLKPREYDATVHRLGLIAFRFCMLFTAFRILEDGELGSRRICSDPDFENVLSMVSVLIRHSSKMFSLLPEEVRLQKKESPRELFLEKLPAEFTTALYMQIARELKIGEKSAESYVTEFVKAGTLIRTGKGQYQNPPALGLGAEEERKEGGEK